MKVLAIGCHPDDEVLGCGGTLLKHAASGDEVYVCVLTNAIKSLNLTDEQAALRKQEAIRAHGMLGAKESYFLEFPSVQMDTLPMFDIIKKIQEVVNEVKPEVVYIHHHGDLNQDHKLAHQACMVACRPGGPTPIKKLLCFEIPSSSTYTNDFAPNYYVDIQEHLERKKAILSIFKSEVRAYPHPRSPEGIEAYARFRGLAIHKEFAEGFEVVRQIL